MFGNLGPWELVLILFIVLVVFGPGKLPKVGESIGKAVRSFRNAQNENTDEHNDGTTFDSVLPGKIRDKE